MGLLGLFFAMSIFRLILFCVTVFVVPPGLWLYPNLFEDVGFFDSFKPLWGWQEVGILSLLYPTYANVLYRPRRRRSRPRSPKMHPLPHRSKNRPPRQQLQPRILQVPWSAIWLRRWKRQRSEFHSFPSFYDPVTCFISLPFASLSLLVWYSSVVPLYTLICVFCFHLFAVVVDL